MVGVILAIAVAGEGAVNIEQDNGIFFMEEISDYCRVGPVLKRVNLLRNLQTK